MIQEGLACNLLCVCMCFFLQTQSSARSLVGSSLEGTVTPPVSAWLPPTLADREHPLTCVVTPQDGWVCFVTIGGCASGEMVGQRQQAWWLMNSVFRVGLRLGRSLLFNSTE